MSVDVQKARREQIRWILLDTLNNARPIGANEELLLAVLNQVALQVTQLEVRRELDYLADRKLVEVAQATRDSASWHAELTRYGVDVVEYTVPCDPGIARPLKYW